MDNKTIDQILLYIEKCQYEDAKRLLIKEKFENDFREQESDKQKLLNEMILNPYLCETIYGVVDNETCVTNGCCFYVIASPLTIPEHFVKMSKEYRLLSPRETNIIFREDQRIIVDAYFNLQRISANMERAYLEPSDINQEIHGLANNRLYTFSTAYTRNLVELFGKENLYMNDVDEMPVLRSQNEHGTGYVLGLRK